MSNDEYYEYLLSATSSTASTDFLYLHSSSELQLSSHKPFPIVLHSQSQSLSFLKAGLSHLSFISIQYEARRRYSAIRDSYHARAELDTRPDGSVHTTLFLLVNSPRLILFGIRPATLILFSEWPF